MAKTSLLAILISFSVTANAQSFPVAKSLDDFFTGIPLQNGFSKWIEYISTDSTLGIDSSTERGFFSSIKKGRSHFPFPDDIPVKILLTEEIISDPQRKPQKYKLETVYIEGMYYGGRKARIASLDYHNTLKEEFRKYYSKRNISDHILFSKSGNKNFPDFMLYRGDPYTSGNEDVIDFYYVILEFYIITDL